jgi:hypothetical protein
MASEGFEAGSEDPEQRTAARTPRRRLEQLREQEPAADGDLRHRMMSSVLVIAGEKGFRGTTVKLVLGRYGGYRTQFYGQFSSLSDCYVAAYECWIDCLVERIFDAGGVDAPVDGKLESALDELARFVEERPELARGLLTEVHVVGGGATQKRQVVLERLATALDRVCRENGSAQPPPITAALMVGAVEAAVVNELLEVPPGNFGELVPGLVELVSVPYLGEAPATR